MRLQQFHINQFGHFADCELTLPSEGLQVIYGPNEAGKTTLLQFLRGWLFDFPARTPYDFKMSAEIGGYGTMILKDGRKVELRRRKGNKNKVSVKIDGRESDLDEVGFAGLIGNANRSLFESVFAFGLDQLSQGEESLKHESLQSALFAGGLGGSASPERILEELQRQAAELFNPQAKKPVINSLIHDLKETAQQIKSKLLRSEDFKRSRDDAEEKEKRAAQLQLTVEDLRRTHARLEKLCRAIPKWTELQHCRRERAPLSVPEAIPTDARARHTAIEERIRANEDEAIRLKSSSQGLERDLSLLKLDPRAISYRAEIRACLEMKQSYLEAKTDLPLLNSEFISTRQQIDRDLHELLPGWTQDDLRNFAVDTATRAELNNLFEEERESLTLQAELRAKRGQLMAQYHQSSADRDALGAPKDVADLIAALSVQSSYNSDLKLLKKCGAELAKIERTLIAQQARLTPPMPASLQNLHRLPAPRKERIVQFEEEFATVKDQLRGALQSLQEDEDELADLEKKLKDLTSGSAVPSLGDRDSARQKRDAGWATLRHQLIDHPDDSAASFDPVSLGNQYEQSVRDADSISDLIYANADAVFKREELARQIEQLSERIEQKGRRIQSLRGLESDLQRRWVTDWQSCGFEPLSPEVMRSWSDDHAAVCESIAKRDEIVADMDTLQTQVDEFEARLRAACGATTDQISVMLVKSAQAVDDAKEQQSRLRELHRDIKRLEPLIQECDSELESVSNHQLKWSDSWKALLSRLNLPDSLDTDVVRLLISRLEAARVKLDALPQEEARLTAMRGRLDEFVARVGPLCDALAPDLTREPPELAIEKLSDLLDRAAEAQKQFDQLVREKQLAQDQLSLVSGRLEKAMFERKELFETAAAETEAGFFEVVTRAEKIRQLDNDLERLAREIDLIRAGEDRDEFERLLTSSESEILEGQRRDFAEQLQKAEQQKRIADGEAAVARNELLRLDGTSEAALLTDRLARQRSRLSVEVDRYVPLLFARHLLEEAVRRFERDNQPEMIATVARLMDRMTNGKYTKFDRTTGNSRGIQVRRFDGAERTPDQLSCGTREQLYLAIRLAYVLHYCRQNEPLPIVMDDVLVNFDDDRARHTLAALAEISDQVQILFFTCHPHMVKLAAEVLPGSQPLELPVPTHQKS